MIDRYNLLLAQAQYWQTWANYYAMRGDDMFNLLEDAQNRTFSILKEAEKLLEQMHPPAPL